MLPNAAPVTRYDLQFRVFGVAARIHWSFWLGGLLFAGRAPNIQFLLAGIAVLFVSIFVHEMGHALCGKYYGDRSPSIVLYWMGGYYMQGTSSLRHGEKIWMLLWGPFAGFILGGIAYGLMIAMERGVIGANLLAYYTLLNAVWINLAWGAMNFLPVYPLDGGQILLEAIRWKSTRFNDATAYTISLVVAIIATIAFLVMAILFKWTLFPAALFGSLAYTNYMLRKIYILTRGYEEESRPRDPWERDADWWKNGEKDDADWWKK